MDGLLGSLRVEHLNALRDMTLSGLLMLDQINSRLSSLAEATYFSESGTLGGRRSKGGRCHDCVSNAWRGLVTVSQVSLCDSSELSQSNSQ